MLRKTNKKTQTVDFFDAKIIEKFFASGFFLSKINFMESQGIKVKGLLKKLQKRKALLPRSLPAPLRASGRELVIPVLFFPYLYLSSQ